MTSIDETELAERIDALAGDVATPLGVEILEVIVKGARGRRLVRIVADTLELDAGGLDVETIAVMSRQLGDVLDEHDVVPGTFTLEVTSPGTDRPLRSPRDFARNIGREVRVTRVGDETDDITGVVVAADEDVVILEVEGNEVELASSQIDHGMVVLPW